MSTLDTVKNFIQGAVDQISTIKDAITEYTPDTGTNVLDDTLSQSSYDFSSRVFPLDVGEAGYNGHYMVININVMNNTRFNQFVNTPAGTLPTFNRLDGEYSKTDVLRFNIDKRWSDSNNRDFSLTPIVSGQLPRQTRRIVESIAIYMPNTVVYDTMNDYETPSLTDLGSQAMSTALSWIPSPKSGSKASLAENVVSGVVGGAKRAASLVQMPINPKIEVLFRNTAQRQFLFEFLMAPRSEEEKNSMNRIIRTLRFHAAPEYLANTQGLLYTPPSEFDITFFNRGVENTNIPRINTCALEKISVDYAPEGVYSTFRDGSPVACRLRLEFRETEIITKVRVLQGF